MKKKKEESKSSYFKTGLAKSVARSAPISAISLHSIASSIAALPFSPHPAAIVRRLAESAGSQRPPLRRRAGQFGLETRESLRHGRADDDGDVRKCSARRVRGPLANNGHADFSRAYAYPQAYQRTRALACITKCTR